MNKKNYTSPEVEKISLDDDVLEYVTGGEGGVAFQDLVWRGRGEEVSCHGDNRNTRNFSEGLANNCYS